SANSSSARRASKIFLRVSASSRSWASWVLTRSSSSARRRATVLTRITSPATTQRRLPASMMAWKTSRAGTRKKSRVTCCLTSSVTIRLTLYCWASRRSVVGALASLRFRVTRSVGRRSKHVPPGCAVARPPASDSNRARPAGPRYTIRGRDRMVQSPPRRRGRGAQLRQQDRPGSGARLLQGNRSLGDRRDARAAPHVADLDDLVVHDAEEPAGEVHV